jgi:PAS domain S-box-containing protein
MATRPPSGTKLLRQMTELQHRLAEAEDTLNAIRSGAVDALVVHTPRGEQLFTLKGADQTYRALVEAMNEGAVTLKGGIISYCNNHFAEMVRMPMEKIFGASFYDLFQSDGVERLIQQVQKGVQARGSIEAILCAADGTRAPVLVSAARFYSEGQAATGLVVTDITERKEIERVRQELSRRIINAQEQERQRVARDLHDSVNQLLASALFRLKAVVRGNRQSSNRQVLDLVERAVGEVKLISRNLRPSELDDLGLLAALRSLSQEFGKRYGIAVHFTSKKWAEPSPLPAEIEMTLYRIVQEALNNVEKHSRAARVRIVLNCSPSLVWLTIHDNGKGFKPQRGSGRKAGWGLQNMNERAQLLGGTFDVKSRLRQGTAISVRIPFGKGPPGI